MPRLPWLSVLMPTYNGAAYLEFALESIVLQADPDIECIVVDDGSTDATPSILEAYQNRLPLLIDRRNRTANWVHNTNLALSMARGEYICFLHQDDIWLGSRLSILRSLSRQYPNVNVFLSSAYFIDRQGNRIGAWKCPLPSLPHLVNPDILFERLLVQNFIPIPAPIFKREVALAVGGMDDTAWYTADWDFWLKLAACEPWAYISQPLTGFRIHPDSQTLLRSSYGEDFRRQHQMIAGRYLAQRNVSASTRRRISKLSAFSIEVNTALASAVHGKAIPIMALLVSFLMLGPVDEYRYVRDSRIWERASARLRARLAKSNR